MSLYRFMLILFSLSQITAQKITDEDFPETILQGITKAVAEIPEDIFQGITKAVEKIPEEIFQAINEVIDVLLNISLRENGRLNFTELAYKYGYACEELDVVTEDGYILKLFHIPGDKKKVVLLNHGIEDSADTFIIRNDKSIALTLASLNYDVWAMSSRGNRYARRHVTLDADKDKRAFFNFSFHEVGYYDIPANIDFILNITRASKLSYIGHSQGTTTMLVMAAEKPQYNEKIKVAVLYAPVAYLSHAKGIIALLVPFAKSIIKIGNALDIQEFFGYKSIINKLLRLFCSSSTTFCLPLISMVQGPSYKRLEPEFLPVLFGHYPAGSSFKSLAHYGQVAKNGTFRQYDYGEENINHYGLDTPPNYDLSKVTTKVALYCGQGDYISVVKDVTALSQRLPNLVKYHVMEPKQWTHGDFTWANNVDTELNPMIVDLLEKYSDA